MEMNEKLTSILVSEINCCSEIRYKLITDSAEQFALQLSDMMQIVHGIRHKFDVKSLFDNIQKAVKYQQIIMLQIVGHLTEDSGRHLYAIIECRPMYLNKISVFEEYEVRPRYHVNYEIPEADDKSFNDNNLHGVVR